MDDHNSNLSEQTAFTSRLIASLEDAGYANMSHTTFATEFNARSGLPPISYAGARKWLVGTAIPVQDRLRALARWLAINPDWLRFGDERDFERHANATVGTEMRGLAADVATLSAKERKLVRELVALLASTSKQNARATGSSDEG